MGAVAGKIMIRPMGEYDPSTVYDILDLVKYDNKPWLCKKSNIMGVTPVEGEYWMNVIDVSIANADTLDGHDSSYFATAEALTELVNVINNITAEDVGARANDWMPTASEVGARPDDWMPSAEDVGALPLTGGTLSGHIVIDTTGTGGIVKRRVVDGTAYNAYFSLLGMTVGASTGLELKDDDGNILARFYFNKNGVWLSDGSTAYKLYGEHNKPSASDVGAAASSHTHAAGDIKSGTLGVARGGTGATTFTSGAALIGAGTGAVTTRAIKHSTTSTVAGTGNDLATCGTVTYHVNNKLNRLDAVTAANTSYATYMARGIALVNTVPTSMTNGCVAFVYA